MFPTTRSKIRLGQPWITQADENYPSRHEDSPRGFWSPRRQNLYVAAAAAATATATATSASQQAEQPQTEQPHTEQHIPHMYSGQCPNHHHLIFFYYYVIGTVSYTLTFHYCCQGCVLCWYLIHTLYHRHLYSVIRAPPRHHLSSF
jgi:hypothetical protein